MFQWHRYDEKNALLADGDAVVFRGVVAEKQESEDSVRYLLTLTSCMTGNQNHKLGRVIFYYPDDSVKIGSKVYAYGRIRAFEKARNQGGFDAAFYYKSLNICFCQKCDTIRILRSPELSISEQLYRLRKRLRSVFLRAFPEDEAAIMTAMVLGDRSLMDDTAYAEFQKYGIAHILAISGLHITLIGMSIYRLLRDRFHLRYGVCCVTASAGVLLFALLSGFSVSAKRAVIMFLFQMGAYYFGRTYGSLTACMYSAAAILLAAPLSVLQTGFLMSYGTILVILLLSPVTASVLTSEADGEEGSPPPGGVRGFLQKRKQDLLNTISLSLTIWLGMLPVTAWFFYQIPVYSVFLNLLLVPFCGYLLLFGLLGGFLSFLPLPVSVAFFIPCHLILRFYEWILGLIACLPGGTWITGKPPAGSVILYYGVLAVIRILWRMRSDLKIRRKNRGVRALRRFLPDRLSVFLLRSGKAPAVCMILPAVLLIWILFPPECRGLEVSFLDVGQGDGIFLCTDDGEHIFIDGGSSSVDGVGTGRIFSFLKYRRVRTMDLWIVTHADEDHISGLMELLEIGYPVDRVILSEASKDDDAAKMIMEAAGKNHTEVSFSAEGSVIRTDSFRMECLFPRKTDTAEDRNGLSQVWLLRRPDLTILFTGDIGTDQERLLAERELLEPVDILKLAHHGSKNSSCEEFLEEIRPAAAVASAGKNNVYGHPSQDTLDRLEAIGCRVCQTIEHGQIRLRKAGGRYRIDYPAESRSRAGG